MQAQSIMSLGPKLSFLGVRGQSGTTLYLVGMRVGEGMGPLPLCTAHRPALKGLMRCIRDRGSFPHKVQPSELPPPPAPSPPPLPSSQSLLPRVESGRCRSLRLFLGFRSYHTWAALCWHEEGAPDPRDQEDQAWHKDQERCLARTSYKGLLLAA